MKLKIPPSAYLPFLANFGNPQESSPPLHHFKPMPEHRDGRCALEVDILEVIVLGSLLHVILGVVSETNPYRQLKVDGRNNHYSDTTTWKSKVIYDRRMAGCKIRIGSKYFNYLSSLCLASFPWKSRVLLIVLLFSILRTK